MSRKLFWTVLAVVSTLSLGLLWALTRTEAGRAYLDFSVLSFLLFFGLSVGLYEVGRISSSSTANKYAFIRVVMISVFLKMMLSIILLFVYTKVSHPSTRFFLIPFFINYLVFTVLEVWVLMRLGKTKTVEITD